MNVRLPFVPRPLGNPSGSPRSWSRRDFVRTTGGGLAAGAAMGLQVLRPRLLSAASGDDPVPIPVGSPVLGGFHIFGPTPDGSLDPIDAEPASITNFDGVVGLAYVDGTVTRTRISTGEHVDLPFIASDMRFMQGVYRGVDGKPRQGTFGFICIDVYDPGRGRRSSTSIPVSHRAVSSGRRDLPRSASVASTLSRQRGLRGPQRASLRFPRHLERALRRWSSGVSAVVSFKVEWSGVQIGQHKNPANGFAGEYVRGQAQMEWTATAGDFRYVSAPLSTSSSEFAELGHERNGSYFPH